MKQYTINSVESMQEFFTDVIVLHNCTLHPDDPFTDMVDIEGNAAFSIEDAMYLDIIMNKCFEYCDENSLDIYEIAGEIQVKEYKKLKILPEHYGTE